MNRLMLPIPVACPTCGTVVTVQPTLDKTHGPVLIVACTACTGRWRPVADVSGADMRRGETPDFWCGDIHFLPTTLGDPA